MLQTLYNALDRHRRPLRNHHFMVFRSAKIVYARVPGAPLRTIRPILDLLSEQNLDRSAGTTPAKVSAGLWEGDIELLSARELRRKFPDLPVFAVVQDPLARLAECFDAVIRNPPPLPAFFQENDFTNDMALEDFLTRAAEISDLQADNLLRSQASILSFKGELVPSLVLDLANLSDGWSELRALVRQQSGREIGKEPPAVSEAPGPHLKAIQRSPKAERLKKRYRKDYRLFFRDNSSCGEGKTA